MKILSNKVWEAILDIARENDRKILELEAENKQLKKQIELMNCKVLFCNKSHTDIDFPNSKKSYEDKIF